MVALRGRPQQDDLLHWSFGTHLPFGACAALGMRRSLHDRIGGFDEAMVPAGEDMDYCWRAQYAGAELRFVSDAVGILLAERTPCFAVASQARAPVRPRTLPMP